MLWKWSVIKTERKALLFGEGSGKSEKHWQRNLGLKLEANSQHTRQLEKSEWPPGSWENHLHLLTAPVPPALGTAGLCSASVPLLLVYFTSGGFPSLLPLVPRLLTEISKDLLTKQEHDPVTPHYFPTSAEGKGTLKRRIQGKGFQGAFADIFALPSRILEASTSSSAFTELEWSAIPNAVLPHFNRITAPSQEKYNLSSD